MKITITDNKKEEKTKPPSSGLICLILLIATIILTDVAVEVGSRIIAVIALVLLFVAVGYAHKAANE